MHLTFDGAYQRFRQSVVDQAAPQVTPFRRPRQYKQVSFADRFWEGIYDDDPNDPFRRPNKIRPAVPTAGKAGISKRRICA